MNTLKVYFYKIKKIKLYELPNKIYTKVVSNIKNRMKKKKDLIKSTYFLGEIKISYSYFDNSILDNIKFDVKKIEKLTNLYSNHQFNILGSGWLDVKHGMICEGLHGYKYNNSNINLVSGFSGDWLNNVNKSNLNYSQYIMGLVNDSEYVPIDWQLDFKSGYRWNEKTWYKELKYGHLPGVDIKIPWELSRMQHLTQFAWAFGLAKENINCFKDPLKYKNEFRNQILDFIATNPPRWGVNWKHSMDVGIRVANWLVSYDLFKSMGAKFDSSFQTLFAQSVYSHGFHIYNNLEWSPKKRGNHYLSNIVGLLFVASYLERNEETDCWLAFAVQELITEVDYQFNNDGSNFEASTSYHRLCSELVIYGTSLVLGLSEDKLNVIKNDCDSSKKREPFLDKASLQPFNNISKENSLPFPKWYIEKLEKMAEFTMNITKPNGKIVQIGDNDSGRFLKLNPKIIGLSHTNFVEGPDSNNNLQDSFKGLEEDILDHSHIIDAINGLFDRKDFMNFSGTKFEQYVINNLVKGKELSSYSQDPRENISNKAEGDQAIFYDMCKNQKLNTTIIDLNEENLLNGLQLTSYPDFGIYIYRSDKLFISIRCGSVGQNGHGGHAHNDQLSLEININGEDYIVDPGTYLYTPLHEMRRDYRSVFNHYSPQPLNKKEPGRLDLGAFNLFGAVSGDWLFFNKNGFVGKVGESEKVCIVIEHDKLILKSEFGRYPSPELFNSSQVPYSPGYGVLRR